MKAASIWQPLIDRLDRCEAAGKTFDFWLRDDDAVEPTAALDRLLELAERFTVPATLAVIPAGTDERLSYDLAGRGDISVAVHGWSHRNHAPMGEKSQELGAHRPREVVLGELSVGYTRLRALHPSAFVPLLVPPWNRIDAGLIAGLPPIGFTALSVFGPETGGKPHRTFAHPELTIINTHVDVIDWHGARGCRDHEEIVDDIVRRLDQSGGGGGATGILTHHLVHDESIWAFLEKLFEISAPHPACRWRKIADLINR